MLGLGDIVIPGLLLSFAHRYDVSVSLGSDQSACRSFMKIILIGCFWFAVPILAKTKKVSCTTVGLLIFEDKILFPNGKFGQKSVTDYLAGFDLCF